MPKVDNPSQLKNAIDAGATRSKVRWPDPAAAPLGTDEEAAGEAISPARVRIAAAQEIVTPERSTRGGQAFAAGTADDEAAADDTRFVAPAPDAGAIMHSGDSRTNQAGSSRGLIVWIMIAATIAVVLVGGIALL